MKKSKKKTSIGAHHWLYELMTNFFAIKMLNDQVSL